MNKYQRRRLLSVILSAIILLVAIIVNTPIQNIQTPSISSTNNQNDAKAPLALDILKQVAIKGRAPNTGYNRNQFGDGWQDKNGCDMRNIILNRDLKNPIINDKCQVIGGTLHDPYTGKTIIFVRSNSSSDAVQIDHVVALSDAWQKGAQLLTLEQRVQLANDPLELIAVDGKINQQKGDGDAATWLPPNKSFRCQYIARQIAVKHKYKLWITQAEHDAMSNILNKCQNQLLPIE